ncbi:D-alanyl-D-alanine carboxypeptidase [Streptomyces rhizosphaerihabitans]|uniref:D-alanyl-D-alanine carboxypeptidase n=1 Tax=Streptomyces rhizosphaerihabitans TaxID=1266770 RepID=UPI0021BE971D|nr:D-alanyl-D-alanine carboxypeptidase [Streptomyces rhizosphaerihabitans]MCT9011211.1 D-alanyl-D-alanine carboxypeptidase [Streptomyces rhizosphaerihabitans]
MEEASVAGESPDRSKQHESSASSAEATPVTPAPVPSPARSVAQASTSIKSSASADPRMAMARERAATVRVDQATAVFSTKALSADASRTAESERTSGPADGADAAVGGSAEGDTRLRAAVAAWVSGSDEPAPADADDADAGSEGAGGPEGGDGATNDAEDADGTDASDADGAEPAGDAQGGDAGAEPAEDQGEPATSGRAEGTSDGPDTGDASDVASDTDEEAAAEPAADLDIDIDTAEEPEADQQPEAASGEAPAADEPEDEPEDKPAPSSALDAALASRAAAEAASKAAPEPAVEDEPEDAPEADPEDEPSDEREDRPAAPSARAAVPATEDLPESASAKPEAAPEAAPEGRPSDSAPGSGDETPDAETDETPATGTDETPATESASEAPVDQPTAIFKAPRRPAVDQPTTMLKLGGAAQRPAAGKPESGPTDATDEPAAKATDEPAAKATGEPAVKTTDEPAAKTTERPAAKATGEPEAKVTERPAPEWGAKPAADPERTSKFVALKPLDEPGAPAWPKPTPAPGTGDKPAPSRGTADRPAAATAAIQQVGPERTTQLPLPPKPPLDLLAELTNTPPPPQTPVRTLVRRVKIWTPLVLLLAVIFAVAQAFRPLPTPGLALTADQTYTFGGGTLDLPWPGQGQSAIEVDGVGSLGTDGKQTPSPTASVAKIMTAYVILQEHPLKGNEDGEKITVDQQAEDESKLPDESTAAMSKGQQFTERQMLQMLMIPSGNNVARLLARWDSDNAGFVAKMNAAAKDLGMTNSTYTDPSGLQKTTVSTATDQIKLAKKVMKNDVFRSIVGMAKADIPGLDNTIYNNNDLLVQQVGVIGLKTGSSTPAGGNLVWAATKNVDGKTQTIYGAVMNQDAGTGKVWDSLHLALVNSQKLIDKVQKSLITATVVKKGQVVGYVDDQLGGRTRVVATKNMTAVGWPGLKTRLSIGEGRSAVPHTGKAGTVVGELTVGDGSSQAVKIPVALQSDLAEPGLGAKLTRVG